MIHEQVADATKMGLLWRHFFFLKLSERRPFGALTAPSGGETFASTNGGGNHAHINCNYCSCWSLLARGMLPGASKG
jgi:hypothetical protein